MVQAEVVRVVPAPEGPGGTAILRVSRAWKAAVPEELAVTTLTSCAYPWQEGEQHVLSLIRENTGLFSTARCLGNQLRSRADAFVRWLEKNGEPKQVRSVAAGREGHPQSGPASASE